MFLCAIEAVNLDNMFADCEDLNTTRGGGLAVLEIASGVAALLNNEGVSIRVRSSGASQGLLEIEGEGISQVEKLVQQHLKSLPMMEHATVMVAACEKGPEEAFQRNYQLLKAKMRFRQMRSASVVYPKLYGTAVCSVDRVRPSQIRDRDLQEKKHQSDFTAARREFGRAERRGLARRLLGDAISPDVEFVKDLNELAAPELRGEFGNADDKIAVLRFDGNDFGKKVADCRTPEALADFSAQRKKEQEAFFRTLIESDKQGHFTKDNKLRLEIVVYGGDEVTFIVPAWLGFHALIHFYRHACTWEGVSYSGAVVFCHRNAPIHSVKRLASGLNDKAKSKDFVTRKDNRALYQVLESFDAIGEKLDDFLKRQFTNFNIRCLVLGLEQMEILQANMDHWRSVLSKRKLYKLVAQIRAGDRSAFEAGGVDGVIRMLLESKGSTFEAVSTPLRKLHQQLEDAAFLHILELWDYVGVA